MCCLYCDIFELTKVHLDILHIKRASPAVLGEATSSIHGGLNEVVRNGEKHFFHLLLQLFRGVHLPHKLSDPLFVEHLWTHTTLPYSPKHTHYLTVSFPNTHTHTHTQYIFSLSLSLSLSQTQTHRCSGISSSISGGWGSWYSLVWGGWRLDLSGGGGSWNRHHVGLGCHHLLCLLSTGNCLYLLSRHYLLNSLSTHHL